MKYKLRQYQQEAVDAMLAGSHLANKSIVCLPTGSGKSLVIADFIDKVKKPTLILTPSREILAQNKEKLLQYVDKKDVGVYSASFNLKEIKKYTFATIQSVYKKSSSFSVFGIVIIDEVHLYKDDGMFDKLIRSMSIHREDRFVKVFGLSATPYRNESETEYDYRSRTFETTTYLKMLTDLSFDDIIYVKNTKELQDEGFLAPLVYKPLSEVYKDYVDKVNSKSQKQLSLIGEEVDTFSIPTWDRPLETLSADFTAKSEKKLVESFELQLSFAGYDKLKPVLGILSNYKSAVIFCPTLRIAEMLSDSTPGVKTAFVSGKTKPKERKQILEDFKAGKIRAIFNVSVLTTGFDHPALDLIVLASPTMSLNKYNQMLGRGCRTAPGKTHCTIIDITGTVKRLGKLEEINIVKLKSGDWDVETPGGFMNDEVISHYEGDY